MRSIFIHDINLSSYIVGFMEIVQDNKSYERACKLIKKQKIVYLDTEFLRDKTYWPLLCILQIKTARKTFIFDFLKKDNFDLSKLKEVFEQNQKVTDAFNIAFESLSIAFNDFFRFLENNVGTITSFFTDIFENPKESLIEFANAFKRNIQQRFESYLDTLGFLASAVKKVFSGDFAGALEDVKNAGKESLDVLTGVISLSK